MEDFASAYANALPDESDLRDVLEQIDVRKAPEADYPAGQPQQGPPDPITPGGATVPQQGAEGGALTGAAYPAPPQYPHYVSTDSMYPHGTGMEGYDWRFGPDGQYGYYPKGVDPFAGQPAVQQQGGFAGVLQDPGVQALMAGLRPHEQRAVAMRLIEQHSQQQAALQQQQQRFQLQAQLAEVELTQAQRMQLWKAQQHDADIDKYASDFNIDPDSPEIQEAKAHVRGVMGPLLLRDTQAKALHQQLQNMDLMQQVAHQAALDNENMKFHAMTQDQRVTRVEGGRVFQKKAGEFEFIPDKPEKPEKAPEFKAQPITHYRDAAMKEWKALHPDTKNGTETVKGEPPPEWFIEQHANVLADKDRQHWQRMHGQGAQADDNAIAALRATVGNEGPRTPAPAPNAPRGASPTENYFQGLYQRAGRAQDRAGYEAAREMVQLSRKYPTIAAIRDKADRQKAIKALAELKRYDPTLIVPEE